MKGSSNEFSSFQINFTNCFIDLLDQSSTACGRAGHPFAEQHGRPPGGDSSNQKSGAEAA
jgi:hypothetical protein